MENDINSLKRTARIAGLLYLIWIMTGMYGMLPSITIVQGDAATTANNLLTNEFLFRISIINSIISNVIWIFIVFTLYKLFRQVNEYQAKLMVALVLVQIPVVFIGEALNIASLQLFKGDLLKTFEPGERQDLAMLFFKINDYKLFVLEMFWGLWLFPFGRLVYKSKFIPRIIGIFLLLNGIAYVIHSITHILLPDYQAIVFKFAIPFWILGEISITLWLLIMGVRKIAPAIEHKH